MSSWLWHSFGTRQCPRCGATVPVSELVQGEHECDGGEGRAGSAEDVEASIALLDAELAEYLASSSARAHLAFARWCREHGR